MNTGRQSLIGHEPASQPAAASPELTVEPICADVRQIVGRKFRMRFLFAQDGRGEAGFPRACGSKIWFSRLPGTELREDSATPPMLLIRKVAGLNAHS